MNVRYINIMEKALEAYTPQRIRDYITLIRTKGLNAHGFPRLTINIGMMVAYDRRPDLYDTFLEMMDLCCERIPISRAANEFSVRELCMGMMLLEEKKTIPQERMEKWKQQLAAIDPWTNYNVVAPSPDTVGVENFAMFGAASELIRGKYLGIDTSKFVDWQLSSQLLNLDPNDLYRDGGKVKNPMLYDLVVRALMAFMLHIGYQGKFAKRIEQLLDRTAEVTLQMQSVTGEIPFGGRSNQFLLNDTLMISYCEMEATRFCRKGDLDMAGKFKAAAALAADKVEQYLRLTPIHHIKNRYPLETKFGCERYGHFNKYMITAASNLYLGGCFADDSIPATQAPAITGGYAVTLSENFHKTFLSAGGYHVEVETNAETAHDANGIGRVHKAGCNSMVCLSVPFPVSPKYPLETENPSLMSLCCFVQKDGQCFDGARKEAIYTLVESSATPNHAQAEFAVAVTEDLTLNHKCSVAADGVCMSLDGGEEVGFFLPVFAFDGAVETQIAVSDNEISVSYDGCVCTYRFDGTLDPETQYYCNRNGRYKVYKLYGRQLHITIEGEKKDA